MSETNEILQNTDLDSTREDEYLRKPYQKPKLQELGDLRTLTLGYSGGVGDSGNPGIQKLFP